MTSLGSMKAEIAGIESLLEDWFCERKFKMERAVAFKKVLDKNNFTGLNPKDLNDLPSKLWRDITTGKPQIETTLSSDAKLRKADMYLELFDGATDAEHPCRPSGMGFFRCMQEHFKDSKACDASFTTFENCRGETIKKQDDTLKATMREQDTADRKAKELFARRVHLLELLSNQ